MTTDQHSQTLLAYADGHITAEQAADAIGAGTSVSEIILATVRLHRRLPDRRDAFTEGEFRRALAWLGLDRRPPDP